MNIVFIAIVIVIFIGIFMLLNKEAKFIDLNPWFLIEDLYDDAKFTPGGVGLLSVNQNWVLPPNKPVN